MISNAYEADPLHWTKHHARGLCPCGSGVISKECCYLGSGRWYKKSVGEIILSPTGINNAKCYLSRFNSCSNEISKEHIISKSIMLQLNPEFVEVKNWGSPIIGNDHYVKVGFNSATSKILCVKCNSALSPLDDSARQAFSRLQLIKDEHKRVDQQNRILRTMHVASGIDLERWIIKALCGLYATGRVSRRDGSKITAVDIPQFLLDALLGVNSLETPLGIYSFLPNDLRTSVRLDIRTLNETSDETVGMLCGFGFLNLYLIISNKIIHLLDREINKRRPNYCGWVNEVNKNFLILTY